MRTEPFFQHTYMDCQLPSVVPGLWLLTRGALPSSEDIQQSLEPSSVSGTVVTRGRGTADTQQVKGREASAPNCAHPARHARGAEAETQG